MVVHTGGPENFILPVGAGAENRGVTEFFGGAETDDIGTVVAVDGKFFKIQDIETLGNLLDAIVAFIAEFGLSGFTALCRNHNHAVACA